MHSRSCRTCQHFEFNQCARVKEYNPIYGDQEPIPRDLVKERYTVYPFDVLLGRCGKQGRFWKSIELTRNA